MNAPKFSDPVLSVQTATALVRRAPTPAAIIRPQTIDELDAFCQRAARSGMVPAMYAGKPDAIFIAVQMGSELGLSPMQALSNIAVVNGRPSVWGDAMPGLCRQSSVCDDIEEWFDGDGETLTAHCKATRVGKQPVLQQFSVTDAKKAGLWEKPIWKQYPRRMLQMRARGFALRDAFPDVLRGLISYEEAQDIPPDTFRGTTIDAQSEPHHQQQPRPQPTTGEIIGDEIPDRVANAPPKQQKPSGRAWLAALRVETDALPKNYAALEEFLRRDDIVLARKRMTNGAKEELEAMIEALEDRIAAAAAETERADAGEPEVVE